MSEVKVGQVREDSKGRYTIVSKGDFNYQWKFQREGEDEAYNALECTINLDILVSDPDEKEYCPVCEGNLIFLKRCQFCGGER